jgi:mRNA-degrading endonuclease RelE of RelBE toxin-antitoxin system
VSRAVVFRETAVRGLARINAIARADGGDRALFSRTRQAIAALADDPYPQGAVPWGMTGIYRLHAGQVRVLYEVDEEAATIYVINVGLLA